jgi:ORF6N domain-containing protein
MRKTPESTVSYLPIERHIHVLRGQKVMLDSDLAELYGVETRRLNEAVKRNVERFPATFMFRLTDAEAATMRSQIATSSKRKIKNQPLAFTEHGVVMLSSVLNSARVVQMSILVVQAFVRMRELIAANKDIAIRVEKLEHSHRQTSSIIEVLVGEIDSMKTLPSPSKRKIAFDL